MADSANTTVAPAIPHATLVSEHRPLVRGDRSYDRAEIMRFAWEEYRRPDNRPHLRPRTFGQCLAYAWRVAKGLRSRMADGSHQREKAEREASQRRRAEALANETPEQAAAAWAIIVRGCSTDGRSINSPLYR